MGGWREGRRAEQADRSGCKKEAVGVVAKFWGGPGVGLLWGGGEDLRFPIVEEAEFLGAGWFERSPAPLA